MINLKIISSVRHRIINRSMGCNKSFIKQKMKKSLQFQNALGISMIVCRHPITKKYLVIQQTDGTWWIPGGRVQPPESFTEAAIRQCKQEAGIDVTIKGILRMEHNLCYSYVRLKSILYAEPIDVNQVPKSVADQESIQGQYLNIQQIKALKKKWREESIFVWPDYLENGGKIYPLSMLKENFVNVTVD